MEDNGQQPLPDQEQNANAGNAGADNPGGEQQIQQPAIEDGHVLEYLKGKGFEINSFDDLRKEPEKIIETVEPSYSKYVTEEDKAYYKYAEETGRSREDYNNLQKNWDDVPALDLARERVRKESGNKNLTNDQIDEYLATKLNIDFDDLGATGEIELQQFARSIREEKKAEQEKYKLPAENKQQPAQPQTGDEYVDLDNGTRMKKSDYEAAAANHQKYLESLKDPVNDVTATGFSFTIDENGSKTEIPITYEFDDADRHGMVSDASDLSKLMQEQFGTENGIDAKRLKENIAWLNPKTREKMLAAMASKIDAQATERVMKLRGNHNFDPNLPLQKQVKDGVTVVPVNQAFNFRKN